MLVDISFKDIFLVSIDKKNVDILYENGSSVTLVFNSSGEAENFYHRNEFIDSSLGHYKASIKEVEVKHIKVY